MSEEIDREAEKEALRRKFEAEEADRQRTEHLSELLLKGATMTNRHCDECGDPIFRYEGREFCPTCQREVGGGAEAAERAEPAGDGPPAQTESAAGSARDDRGSSPPTPAVDGTDIEAARASLARKLTALAREAETATDLHRTRSLLEATREAAEALRAIEALDR